VREFRVQFNGAEFIGEQAGAGDALVFLHCGVADHRQWRAQLDAFSKTHHCISYSRRGYGETQHDDRAFSEIDDLKLIMDHFGHEKATLVGNSLGGGLSIDFALADPDRVRAVCLVGSAVTGDDGSWYDDANDPPEFEKIWLERKRVQADGTLDQKIQSDLRSWIDGPLSPENRVDGQLRDLFAAMDRLAHTNEKPNNEIVPEKAVERLGELKVPVLSVCGLLDLPYMVALHQRFEQKIQNIESHYLENCAHLPAFEKPEAFNPILSAFLQRI